MTRFAARARLFACLTVSSLLSACWWDGNGDSATTAAVSTYSLGGTISGLGSAGLVLSNGSDTVSPASGATSFTFAGAVAQGARYDVTVTTQPAGANCAVTNGSGTTAGANVTNLQVTCTATPSSYTIGGSLSGLTGAGLVLTTGTDTVAPAANAANFTFPTAVANGTSYMVTVATQPVGEQCSVAQAVGTIAGANATNVAVTCQAAGGLSVLAGNASCPSSGNLFVPGTGSAASLGSGFMTFDTAGNLYLDGDFVVAKVTPAGVVTLLAGTEGVSGTVDGTGAAARFGFIESGATDASGNLYLPDSLTIRKITPAGVVTTLAGDSTQPGFVDGTGGAALFNNPLGAAVDGAGNVYIADTSNHAIRKVTQAGVVTTLAGNGVAGSADGAGSAARFDAPSGIVSDAAGNLFVADTGNHTVRKITPAGVVSTFVGIAGTSGYVDGPSGSAEFSSPQSLFLDAAGNLYVSDAIRSLLRKVTPAGVVSTVADVIPAYPGAPTGAGIVTVNSQYSALFGVNSAGRIFVSVFGNCSVRSN